MRSCIFHNSRQAAALQKPGNKSLPRWAGNKMPEMRLLRVQMHLSPEKRPVPLTYLLAREFHFICGLEASELCTSCVEIILDALKQICRRNYDGIRPLVSLCARVFWRERESGSFVSARSLVIIISAPACLCRCCYYLARVDEIHSN
jgi:hypothetical protein